MPRSGGALLGALLVATMGATMGALLLASCSSPAPATLDSGVDAAADAGRADTGAVACRDNATGDYPAGPYERASGKTLPNDAFDAIASDGTARRVSLAEYRLPCSAEPSILVLRIGAQFCGTCQWSVEHSADFEDPRAQYLDIQVANADNRAPSESDLRRVRGQLANAHAVAADPADLLAAVSLEAPAMPIFVYLDRRSMRVLAVLSDPPPELAADNVGAELALLRGAALPPRRAPVRVDGLTLQHRGVLAGMAIPVAPPPDPTNRVAESVAAREFGRALFADTGLSRGGLVACATCHDAAKGFADGIALAKGVEIGKRNSPSILYAAYNKLQFWDGRADSLWMQALGPFENPKEMNSTRLDVAHAVAARFRAAYVAAFPDAPLPALADSARFPMSGKPGDPAYEAMTAADKLAATTVFVNVGKAIAAYERSLRAEPNALDRYLGGDLAALTAREKAGMSGFFVSGCAQCHWGPTLSDHAFHNLRFPSADIGQPGDRGVLDGIPNLLSSPFSSVGAFSDARGNQAAFDALARKPGEQLGAFKTPPLRGVADTAPYSHAGALPDLEAVIRHYGKRGLPPADPRAVGVAEPWAPFFDDLESSRAELAAFLRTLTAKSIP